MSKKNISSYFLAFGLATIAFVVVLLATFKIGGLDDAYITYVFARNLAQGHGIVWNIGGNHVYGSTTFTYTVLLALFGYLGFDIPTVSIVIGAVFWALSYFLLFLKFEKTLGRGPTLIGVLLGAISLNVANLSYGMETGLYTFLIILSFMLYMKDRLLLSSFTCGLLVMTRLDGILVPVIILLHFLFTSKLIIRKRLIVLGRTIWPIIVILLLWMAWLYSYFGNVLPNSFLAKNLFDDSVSGKFSPLYFFDIFLPGRGFVSYLLVTAFFIAILVGIIKAFINWQDRNYLIFLWVPAYIGMYFIKGMPHSPWYYAPPIPVFYIIFIYGLSHVYRSVTERNFDLKNSIFPFKMLIAQGIIILVIAIVGVTAVNSYRQIKNNPFGKQTYLNEERRVLGENVLKDMNQRGIWKATLMAFEVGYLGYLVPGEVYDILGLVSPDVVKNGGSRNPLYILTRYKPEYAVIVDTNLYPPTGPIHQSFEFQTNYKTIFTLPRPFGHNYKVFHREPLNMKSIWFMKLTQKPQDVQQVDLCYKAQDLVALSRGNDPFIVWNGLNSPKGSNHLLKITVNSLISGVFEIIPDFGQGFQWNNSYRFLLQGKGDEDFAMWLPNDASIKALRLDPLDRPGKVTIKEVSLWTY